MPSPFPGMDPYLEHHEIWPDVHHRLISAIGDALTPQVAPDYYVAIEERTYIVEVDGESFVGRPDVAVVGTRSESGHELNEPAPAALAEAQTVTLPVFEEMREGYLEIRAARGHEVITIIELLSPTNKAPGIGRDEYEAKRRQVLYTRTNLLEIDLLRAGEPMEMAPAPRSDYRILVRAGWESPRARLYAFNLRRPIPTIPVPLRRAEPEARLPIGDLLAHVYDRARYDLRLDYDRPPVPALSLDDAAWAKELQRNN